MTQTQLKDILLEQCKDLIWMIDPNLHLIYANNRYLSLMKKMTGVEKKLNESVLVEGFGKGYIEKWTDYYNKALKGAYFEIEEHYFNPILNEIQYSQVSFEPLTGDDQKLFAVACRSRDITRIVKHKSEANQMIDSSLDVLCTVNELGNFVFVSAASAKLWGYLPEELIGKAYIDLILEEDVDKTNEIAAAIMNGQDVKSFVNRYKKKDGSTAYMIWSSRWDDTAKLMYCVGGDGKEKIEQEEKILQSEQRFKALVQGAFDIVGVVDTQGIYLYMSPSITAITGMPPENFIGINAFEFVHPDDRKSTLDSLEKSTIEDKVIMEPFRAKNHKNEWRWVETVLTNMLDNPAVKGIVVNSRDITDRVEERQKLKLLESVITNTTDAILITEAEQYDEPGPKIIYVNEAFTKMTGYTFEEVIGKTPRMLQGPHSDKIELAKLNQAIKNWESHEITTINYKKNGEEFWINFSVTPVANEKGWFTHWIAIERDVTEQKNKKLEKELLAKISTNFNTENDLISSTKELCKSICEFGKFDWVEVWTTNLEKSQIQLLNHFVAAPEDEKFYDYNIKFNVFKIAEGLAGNVWFGGEQIVWDDINNQKGFVRKEAAKNIGLKAVLGIPLIFNDEVVGVLNIGTKHSGNYLKKFTQILKKLEGYIGSALNRKKLENDLSHLFNTIPDILCISDFKGRFLKINKAGCELLGYSEIEILYHSFNEFVHPEDANITFSETERLVHGETTFGFENRYLTKTGDIIWLSWNCNTSIEEGLIYATAKNITEEKKLRELNRQVSEIAKIGSWEMDLTNQKVFWSDEIHKLHETDPKSFVPNLEIGINFYRADFRQVVHLNVEKCISTGEPFDFEAVLVTAKKKERWVRAIGNGEFTDGECKRIYGSFQDISSIKESENRLIALSENLPGVVYQYIIHPDGTDSIQYISGMVEQLWGYTTKEIMGNINLLWDQIKLGGEMEEVKASIRKSIQTKTRWTSRFKVVMPNGELKTHLGNSAIPILLADGSIVFNVIVLDITKESKIENLLSQTSKIARIGSWELDFINQDGDNMFWSPMLMEILELDDSYNPSYTGGLELLIGESKDRIQQATDLLIKEGIEFDEECLVLTGKGNKRWVRSIGKSEMANNKRTKIYGSFQDINNKKLAALELDKTLKSLSDYKFALEQSAIIAFTDNKGMITSVNDNFCTISKYDKKEIIGKTHQLINSNYHPKEFFNHLWTTIASGKVWRGEIKNKAKDESHYWEDTSIVPFLDENNKPVQYLAICFDISERKKADEENKFKANLLSMIGQATIATDINGVVNFWNKAAENIYGWKKEEAIGENIMNLTTLETNKELAIQIMEVLKKGETWSGEFKVRKKDGTSFPALITNSPILDEQNILSGILGISSDITQEVRNQELLKQYTLELERSNEELEQFAFVTSHDLQEPLRMISSFMDQLKRKYEDRLDEKALKYIYFATDGAKRMRQIILDLLDYSRANKPAEVKEAVDLNETISEFKQLRRKLISEKGATIISNVLPTLNTCKAAITQILHCLIDNALKYSKEDSPSIVEINAIENEKEWEFSIKDNGIGIDPQFYDKIFIIFQRLHNKEDYEGTGIGLSIAKRHIEFLGGRIWLKPAPLAGTVFYFTIPKV